MKTSVVATLALSLLAGTASAMTHTKDISNEINSVITDGNVVVYMDGSTATLTGKVNSKLDSVRIAQAAKASDGVSKVINLISTN